MGLRADAWGFRWVVGTAIVFAPAFASGQSGGRDLMSDTWVAVDGLGRVVPTSGECPPPRSGKYVGVFYIGWHGVHGYDSIYNPSDEDQGVLPKEKKAYRSPYDVTQILAADPKNPPWGPPNAFHHACEPELGYYLSDDEYVIRKHIGMLNDAGVDVVFLDVTNSFTYRKVYQNLFRVFHEVRAGGERTPQIAFMAHFGHVRTVERVYEAFYRSKLYPELWFRWLGKPLLLSPVDGLSDEIKAFFTIRHTWAWSASPFFGDGRDKWTFFDHSPARPGWHERPDKPEQISVTTAQHASTNIGRSYQQGKQPPPEQQRPAEGLYFAEQWKRALEVDPEMVFVVDWNEWTAMRFVYTGPDSPWNVFLGKPLKPGDSWFVDQYTQEYSRSIEPMKGGHGDAYYYQLAANIRRFKGVRPIPTAGPARAIRIDGRFEDWGDVAPEFRDAAGDTFHRNHPGWGRIDAYVDATGRNDFVTLKVTDDEQNIFFYGETREPITNCRDPNWMLLFIDADANRSTGWEGYEYVVNRSVPDTHTTTLARFDGSSEGGSWRETARLPLRYAGRHIELAVPRSALGLAGRREFRFDFHWADNIQSFKSVLEFSLHGDSAPDRRFNYRYIRGLASPATLPAGG